MDPEVSELPIDGFPSFERGVLVCTFRCEIVDLGSDLALRFRIFVFFVDGV